MRRHVLAWVFSIALLPLVGAGTAMADTASIAGQSAEQVALSGQSATADATSKQINPTNTNISVRVLSDGNDGDVTQSNTSAADATAGNLNATGQLAGQIQGGGGGGGALQEAAQKAVNLQGANANATSTQVKPTNTNISVRVLSDGHNGDVTQNNTSTADATAGNLNHTGQGALQVQGGGGDMAAPAAPSSARQACPSACEPRPDKCDPCQPERDSCGSCDSGGVGIQALGQKAVNLQHSDANADSLQCCAKNLNAPVSIGGGHDQCGCEPRKAVPVGGGDVTQSNTSSAEAWSGNKNGTLQAAGQFQLGGGGSPIAIQALGQSAFNLQHSDADATSHQLNPTNANLGGSGGGDVDQSNDSSATAWSGNKNGTLQFALQAMGGLAIPLRL